MKVLIPQSYPTLCDPMDCSPTAPLSMEFPKQEYRSRLSFPSPGDLPNPGVKPRSLDFTQILCCLSHQGSPGYVPGGTQWHFMNKDGVTPSLIKDWPPRSQSMGIKKPQINLLSLRVSCFAETWEHRKDSQTVGCLKQHWGFSVFPLEL